MKPPKFEYFDPRSIQEAAEILGRHEGFVKVLAGGQSLIPMMNLRLAAPDALVDISNIPALNAITTSENAVNIGAMVTQSQVIRDKSLLNSCPGLARAAMKVGHWQIRERGTVVGSIAHADPAAEMPLMAALLGAEMNAVSETASRAIKAEQFFLGVYTTDLSDDELLSSVSWPMAPPRSGVAVRQYSQRVGDFAVVSVGSYVQLDESGDCREARLAFGGTNDRPYSVSIPMAVGEPVEPDLWTQVVGLAIEELEPISDSKASSAQRRRLAEHLAHGALAEAVTAARSEGVQNVRG